jgi:P27 family predicted phage terminase small subunit
VAPELDRLGLLALLDRASLAVYCEGWATYVDAQRDVDRRGALVKGHRKQQVKNPSLQIARDQAQLLRALAAEFGLTPSSRARLGAPEVGDEGDEDIFDA